MGLRLRLPGRFWPKISAGHIVQTIAGSFQGTCSKRHDSGAGSPSTHCVDCWPFVYERPHAPCPWFIYPLSNCFPVSYHTITTTESPSNPSILRLEASRAFLADLPLPGIFLGRMAVSCAVCVDLGLVDALGRPQVSSCMTTLVTLEAEGVIRLPPKGPGSGVP